MSLLYESQNLVKRYGDADALVLPSFRLEKNEVLLLTGSNGSGWWLQRILFLCRAMLVGLCVCRSWSMIWLF